MKILFVGTGPLRNGGVAYYQKALADEFRKNGHEINIVGLDQADFRSKKSSLIEITTDEFAKKPIRIYDLISNGIPYFGETKPLYHCQNPEPENLFKELLSELCPDVVHFHAARPASLISITHDLSIPTVVSHHDYWFMCALGFLIRHDNTLCDGPHHGFNCAQYCQRRFSFSFSSLIGKMAKWAYNSSPLRIQTFIRRLASIYFSLKYKNKPQYRSPLAPNKNLTTQELFPWITRTNYMKWLLMNKVDLNIAVSHYVYKKYYDLGVTSNNFKVLNSGFENAFDFFDKISKIKNTNGRLVLGYISPIFRAKGLHILIEAMKKIPKDKVELLIYGHNSEPAYYTWIQEQCKNLSNITFCGQFEKYEQLPEIYSKLDIAVIPPITNDTSPRVVWEALASKTLTIASNAGGIPDFIQDGINGVLFERGNADDLAEKINIFVNNPEKIDQIRNNIKPLKTIQAHALELLDIYQQIIASKS